MSFRQTRPQTAELVDLHVLYVPEELWNSNLNTVSTDVIGRFISAGFIRVSPDMRLQELRERLGEFLWEDVLTDTFLFLKCVGRSLAVVKRKQEKELKLKSFAPPYALQPELYLLPGVDHVDSICALSPGPQLYHQVTPDMRHHNAVVPDIQLYNLASPDTQHYNASVPNTQHYNALIPEVQVQSVDFTASHGSPQRPRSGNHAKQKEVNIPTLIENHKKTLIRPDVSKENAFRWTGKEKESTSVLDKKLNQGSDQNKKTEGHSILASSKDETSIPVGHISEKISELTEARMRMGRNTTGDSGIPESLKDRDMEYAQNKKRQEEEEQRDSARDLSKNPDHQLFKKETLLLPPPVQYSSPPSAPLLALTTPKVQVPTLQTERGPLIEQLKQMKDERKHLEKTREELVKKAKGLLEQNKLQRNQARDVWKKKYFETKKITSFLEERVNKLRQELELYYQKLLTQLEARDTRKRTKHPTLAVNSKNNMIIQVTTKQQEIDQLRRKLDNTKMKLVVEIKMRRQAASDLRALRAELAQKKIQSSLSTQPSISVI